MLGDAPVQQVYTDSVVARVVGPTPFFSMPRFWISLVTLWLCASTLGGQTPDAASGVPAPTRSTPAPSALRGTVTANPFAALAGFFSGDAEVKVSPTLTFGIGATVNTIDDYNNYRAIDLKLRYYPNEKVLRGFAVAATAGISTAIGPDWVATGSSSFFYDGISTRRFTRPSIGTELSYQWLLGPTSRFAVVLGAGVKRMFGQEGTFDPMNIPLLPMGRASIGYAF